VGPDVIHVSTPLPLTIEISRADEIGDDALCCPLGDVQQGRKVTNADSRVTSDQQERIAVICEEPKVWDSTQPNQSAFRRMDGLLTTIIETC
jgi:hypothetical protein